MMVTRKQPVSTIKLPGAQSSADSTTVRRVASSCCGLHQRSPGRTRHDPMMYFTLRPITTGVTSRQERPRRSVRQQPGPCAGSPSPWTSRAVLHELLSRKPAPALALDSKRPFCNPYIAGGPFDAFRTDIRRPIPRDRPIHPCPGSVTTAAFRAEELSCCHITLGLPVPLDEVTSPSRLGRRGKSVASTLLS